MRILIYAGPAPSREAVFQYSSQIVRPLASAVTLVAGADQQALLEEAASRLGLPEHVPVTKRALPGDAQTTILKAARAKQYDLVIIGRLNQPIGRLLPGPHSKAIAQRLAPSVLRVHGVARPIHRILVASGGDFHTYDDVEMAGRIARPLGASVTLVHILSQQSLLFEGFVRRGLTMEDFLASDTPEATTLRTAMQQLRDQGIETQATARVGPVVDEILAELRIGNYDMLVIGAHRISSPLDRILLEDITGDLLDLSALPVLVVKGQRTS